MQRSFSLQISDLENSQSGFLQELTDEESEKIVGGGYRGNFDDPSCPGCYNLSRLKGLKTDKFPPFEIAQR